MTEQLRFYFLLLCIGEGNGNPLQCSCLENPRDGEAWWAAVYGVAELDTTEATQQQQQLQVPKDIMPDLTKVAKKKEESAEKDFELFSLEEWGNL